MFRLWLKYENSFLYDIVGDLGVTVGSYLGLTVGSY